MALGARGRAAAALVGGGAATGGAAAAALLAGLGLPGLVVMLGGIAAAFVLRAGSLLFGWSFPKLPGKAD